MPGGGRTEIAQGPGQNLRSPAPEGGPPRLLTYLLA
jgi:hypothetical protein